MCAQVALLFLVRGTVHHEATWAAWLDDARELIPVQVAAASCCGTDHENQRWRPAVASSDKPGSAAARDDAAAELAQSDAAAAACRHAGDAAVGGGSMEVSPSAASIGGNSTQCSSRASSQQYIRAPQRASHQPGQPLTRRHWRRRRRRGFRYILQAQQLFSVYAHPAPGFRYQRTELFAGREIAGRVQVRVLPTQTQGVKGSIKEVAMALSREPSSPEALLLLGAHLR